ncbi:hypothetical protein [Methanothermobacter sp. THM-1]|uniref:hypothetical protein n=1 Tax=Methanothermobacter sp. THM-1 TaxID=2606911 RepID=UPI001EE1BB0A|nr:hypothetical protein [Methanothermobacter sp. THM-1]
MAAELAPAKNFHPFMERYEHEYHCLCHGSGVREVLGGLCSSFHDMGTGRSRSGRAPEIAYLVARDIVRTWRAMGRIDPDLVLTCGNAGDVRKAISASLLRGRGVLHIEQDIYNPIEMIAFADIITAPSGEYRDYLEEEYLLENVEVIGGYPHALHVRDLGLTHRGGGDFILLVLGGDLKGEDIPGVMGMVGALNRKVVVVPFRFSSDYVRGLAGSRDVRVLAGFVDLPSLMRDADLMIYGAGMGVTIEAAVMGVPSIKLRGFHRRHASVDLAESVGIPVAGADDLPFIVDDLKPPRSGGLVKKAERAVDNIGRIVESFDDISGPRGGLGSMRRIWNARKKF